MYFSAMYRLRLYLMAFRR